MSLPRRAFLGAHLGPDEIAFGPDGMTIDGVVDGTMAAAAGLRAGDRIESIGGLLVSSLCRLGHALREAGRASHVDVVYARNGARHTATVDVQPVPRETIDGQQIDYGDLESRGAWLRTIASRPAGDTRGTVMFVQGIACETIEGGFTAELVRAWARAGLATWRTDKPGVGDSEGGPCADVDFQTEVAAHRAALDAVLAGGAARPLYLFGHSIGGMIAALLAGERPIDGIVVYGTSTMSWLDCIEATTERQLAMRGVAAGAIAARIASLRERVAIEGLNGRSAAFHRQLDAVDLEDAWRRARVGRVLVARGEHDWVVSPGEQARVADIARAAGAGAAIIDLPGLDHVMGWHPDAAHSMAHYGSGRPDPALGERSAAWMVSSGA